jgi:serine O-acetyltransferase
MQCNRLDKGKKNEDLVVQNESHYIWNPDKMVEMLIKGKEVMEIEGKELPSKDVVLEVLKDLLIAIFPGYSGNLEIDKYNIKYSLGNLLISIYSRLVNEADKSLKYVCRKIKKCPEDVCLRRAQIVVKELLENIPKIRSLLKGDIEAAFYGDPAAKSTNEVILSYPCVFAIATYRIAHELYVKGVPMVPRIMSEYAHSKTGIDIHPGAKIGFNFFIDHGTGVVIGETTEIGNNVKIYQGVTLGALSFPKNVKGKIIRGKKRHPSVGNNVIIYSGATILGGKTVIGDNSIIGGNAWITASIPPETKIIVAPPDLHYLNKDQKGNTKK